MSIVGGNLLGKALMDEGLVPEGCSNAELHIPATGLAFFRFDVWLRSEDFEKLARVLKTMQPALTQMRADAALEDATK